MFDKIQENNVYKSFINGEWEKPNENALITIKSPIDQSVVGKIPALTKDEVDKAITGAQNAYKDWAKRTVVERAEIMHKAADLLESEAEKIAPILTNEIAKDYKSSISEIVRTAEFIRFTAEEGKRLHGETIQGDSFAGFKKTKMSFVTREAVGVVLAIAPFNYPINLSASKIVPALMGGNAVAFKPPTQGAISALHLVRVLHEAGLPDGLLNVITGKGSEIGDYVVTHPDINLINFTGSTQVGQHIADIAGMIPMIMELGGKDAAIVLEDADLDDAATNIVKGAFSYSGQRCTAVKRVLVVDSVADVLVEKIKQQVENLKVGNPFDEVTITPLIDKKGADFVESLIEDALDKKATLLVGNKREDNLIYPTVLDHVTTDMKVAWEEPFGPVLPIIRVSTVDEAINIANTSEYGLQSAVFTSNIDSAFYVGQKLEVGTVQINNKTERGPDHFPFLGIKASGLGTQGIRYSIEAMTRLKAIVVNINEK